MKPGQIIMIFTDPFECKLPEGQAKLVCRNVDKEDYEEWEVEFLDQEGKIYQRLIKKI